MKAKIHMLFRNTRRLVLAALIMGPSLLAGTGHSGSSALMAQEHRDQRRLKRSFPATLETTLEIQNKYGKVQVVNWDKDSVAFEVEVILNESSASKLRKLKDDVKIDFTGTNTYIIAKTVIQSESGRIASELRSIGNTIAGTNKRMEINYMVHIPQYIDVVVNNKFGDIYMDDLEGQLDISLSNGAIKANRILGNSTISLSFANGSIKELGSTTMSLSYSDMELGSVGQLDLDSKSSELNVDSVNVVKINSRRDNFKFNHVEYLYGNSSFTQVEVASFLRESDVYMKYGGLVVRHVLPQFTKIFVESEYTDVSLSFDRETTFDFDILHNEKAVLRLPGNESLSEDSFDGKEHYKTVGTLGEGRPTGTVNIDALQKCYINISYK